MTRGRRITAARHLRLLASLEILVVQGNYSEVRRLLNAVDPLEMRELAAEIESDGEGPIIPLGNPSVIDAWRETYPQVIHGNDGWSRKVSA